jgi:transcriptional regulator of NAD metabolism
MTNQTIAVGDEGLIKHVPLSIGSRGPTYRTVRVTRITKARVFVKGETDGTETEFRLDNLLEYGRKPHMADHLILDQGEIASVREEQARQEARRALEARASKALSELTPLFSGYSLRQRTTEEILLLEELRDKLRG